MNTLIFTRKATPDNSGERNLNQMLDYLAKVEAVARHGRKASDPKGVRAAVWTFARPSAVLARLAARDRWLA